MSTPAVPTVTALLLARVDSSRPGLLYSRGFCWFLLDAEQASALDAGIGARANHRPRAERPAPGGPQAAAPGTASGQGWRNETNREWRR